MKEKVSENSNWPQKLYIASPRGFCVGVERIIEVLETARQEYPDKEIYINHAPVHNTYVVSRLEKIRVKVMKSIDDISEDSIAAISAHDASPQEKEAILQKKPAGYIDGACPLVKKPHDEVKRLITKDPETTILYIGHAGHAEAIGVIGEAPNNINLIQTPEDATSIQVNNPEKVALLMQTTLSQRDAGEMTKILRERFPNIWEPKVSDICFATQNRQDGVEAVVKKGAEAIVVVSSQTSSNGTRLVEVAVQALRTEMKIPLEEAQKRAIMVDDASTLDPNFFINKNSVGITAAASTPEDKVQEVVSWLIQRGGIMSIEDVTVADESNMQFALPKIQHLNQPTINQTGVS